MKLFGSRKSLMISSLCALVAISVIFVIMVTLSIISANKKENEFNSSFNKESKDPRFILISSQLSPIKDFMVTKSNEVNDEFIFYALKEKNIFEKNFDAIKNKGNLDFITNDFLSNKNDKKYRAKLDIEKIKKEVKNISFFTKLGLKFKSKSNFNSFRDILNIILKTIENSSKNVKCCYMNIFEDLKVGSFIISFEDDKGKTVIFKKEISVKKEANPANFNIHNLIGLIIYSYGKDINEKDGLESYDEAETNSSVKLESPRNNKPKKDEKLDSVNKKNNKTGKNNQDVDDESVTDTMYNENSETGSENIENLSESDSTESQDTNETEGWGVVNFAKRMYNRVFAGQPSQNATIEDELQGGSNEPSDTTDEKYKDALVQNEANQETSESSSIYQTPSNDNVQIESNIPASNVTQLNSEKDKSEALVNKEIPIKAD